MKSLYTLICFLLCAYLSSAQNIQFSYDESGNRILRKPSEALPVTLISFTAENLHGFERDASSSIALLKWHTSSEINFDYFKVQRSSDGKNWLDIGSVNEREVSQPAKNVPTNDTDFNYYSFRDELPKDGENLYRLKMIDIDQSFAYSKIRNLYFEPQVSIYPNPVKELLNLKKANLKTVQIFDNSGKLVIETSHCVTAIDVSALATGLYAVKLVDYEGNAVIKKIVKE